LVDAAQLAAELGSHLVPLQLRMAHASDARALLLSLAASVRDPVSALPRLEALAAALAVAAGGGRQAMELDALHSAVAEHALRTADRRTALRLAIGLVDRRYGPAWTVCERLCEEGVERDKDSRDGDGDGRESTDRQLMEAAAFKSDLAEGRPALLAHALAHCPPDWFGPTMERWRRAAAAATGGTHGSAQAPAVSASRDPALALALSCDRPSAEKLGTLRSQLSASVLAAADAAAPTALRRVCRLGKRAYAVALAAVARDPPTAIRRVTVAPASQLGAVVDRCVAAVQAGATAEAATDGTARTSPGSGAVGGPGNDISVRIVSECRAAQAHFHALESIEARLSEAEAVRLHLPDVNVAAYATDESVRRDVIRRLARCASGEAFELAQALAGAGMAQQERARAGGAQPVSGGRAARGVVVLGGGRLGACGCATAAVEGVAMPAKAGAGELPGDSVQDAGNDARDGAVVGASGGEAKTEQGAKVDRRAKADQRADAAKAGAETAGAAGGEEMHVKPGVRHPSGALDAWELRMARVDAVIWETVRVAESKSGCPAVPALDAGARTAALVAALRTAVAAHKKALLAQPARMSLELATVTLRQSSGEACPAVLLCVHRPAVCPSRPSAHRPILFTHSRDPEESPAQQCLPPPQERSRRKATRVWGMLASPPPCLASPAAAVPPRRPLYCRLPSPTSSRLSPQAPRHLQLVGPVDA
jgi:hypothetical protein